MMKDMYAMMKEMMRKIDKKESALQEKEADAQTPGEPPKLKWHAYTLAPIDVKPLSTTTTTTPTDMDAMMKDMYAMMKEMMRKIDKKESALQEKEADAQTP